MDTIENKELIKIDTKVNGADEEDVIMVTLDAIDKLREIITENDVPDDYFLRFAIQGGGCHGMNYTLGFDSKKSDRDRVFLASDIDLVIDNKSLFYLMGVTVDYVETDTGKGFVFKTPNDAPACGCGH